VTKEFARLGISYGHLSVGLRRELQLMKAKGSLDTRRAAALTLAEELRGLVLLEELSCHDDDYSAFVHYHDSDRARTLASASRRIRVLAADRARTQVLDLALACGVPRAIITGVGEDRDLYSTCVLALEIAFNQRDWSEAAMPLSTQAVGRLLIVLAQFLPGPDRSRFVAEAQGNLGACDRWWQRGDHLVCLALGMPRLAWMMWRDGRRGRV
jgi:hypothetical protein